MKSCSIVNHEIKEDHFWQDVLDAKKSRERRLVCAGKSGNFVEIAHYYCIQKTIQKNQSHLDDCCKLKYYMQSQRA
jgi:hypothetical protein